MFLTAHRMTGNIYQMVIEDHDKFNFGTLATFSDRFCWFSLHKLLCAQLEKLEAQLRYNVNLSTHNTECFVLFFFNV